MKNIISIIAALGMILLCRVCVSAEVYLDDRLDLYPDDQVIIDLMQEAADTTGWNIGIVTCDYDYDPETKGEYIAETEAGEKAEEITDEVFGRSSNSVLFLCDVGYRYVCVANEPRKYVVGDRFDAMIKDIESHYFDYDDLGTAKAFINNVVACYNKGEVSASEVHGLVLNSDGYYEVPDEVPDHSDTHLIIAFVIAFLIALFIAICVVADYSKPTPVDANEYLDKNSMDMYDRQTLLVNTRHYSYTVSSSSGGGHSGGGGFSGGHHGGGGHGGHR